MEDTSERSRTATQSGQQGNTCAETGGPSISPACALTDAATSLPSCLTLTRPVAVEARGSLPSTPGTLTKSRSSTTSLPPSPKAGEGTQPLEHHATIPTEPVSLPQPQSCPSWPVSISSRPSLEGLSHAPITWSNYAIAPTPIQSAVPSIAREPRKGSYAHPPGYMQNPYALEATAEQRFAVEQKDEHEEGLPMPTSTHRRKSSTASVIIGGTVVDLLKKARRNTKDFIEGFQEWTQDAF
ncbi:MAG: hypothetical protein Q9218_001062 [Villophora microphyllina]